MSNTTDTRTAEARADSQQQMGMRRTIELGAMSPPLSKQLAGLKVPKARLRILDKLAESLTWCYASATMPNVRMSEPGANA